MLRPVVPVYMRHFGKLAQSEAAELFAKLRDEEIAEGAPGGSEFSIEFWHHTTLPAEPKFMFDDDGTIYHVAYPSSTCWTNLTTWISCEWKER